MDNNNIYDLIALLKNPAYFNSDIIKAAGDIQKGIENTYVKKIYQMTDSEEKRIKKAPTREVVLLKAIKAYVAAPAKNNIDSIINLLNTIDILNHVNHSIYDNNQSINIKSNDTKSTSYFNNGFIPLTDILFLMALNKKL